MVIDRIAVFLLRVSCRLACLIAIWIKNAALQWLSGRRATSPLLDRNELPTLQSKLVLQTHAISPPANDSLPTLNFGNANPNCAHLWI
jgi:hypothetical protein